MLFPLISLLFFDVESDRVDAMNAHRRDLDDTQIRKRMDQFVCHFCHNRHQYHPFHIPLLSRVLRMPMYTMPGVPDYNMAKLKKNLFPGKCKLCKSKIWFYLPIFMYDSVRVNAAVHDCDDFGIGDVNVPRMMKKLIRCFGTILGPSLKYNGIREGEELMSYEEAMDQPIHNTQYTIRCKLIHTKIQSVKSVTYCRNEMKDAMLNYTSIVERSCVWIVLH